MWGKMKKSLTLYIRKVQLIKRCLRNKCKYCHCWQNRVLFFVCRSFLLLLFLKISDNKNIRQNKHLTPFRKKSSKQKLRFCVHNVVLDTHNLIFSPFPRIDFFKNAQNAYLFCMACFVCLGQCRIS